MEGREGCPGMFLGMFVMCPMGMSRAEEGQGTLPGAPGNGSLPTASQTCPKTLLGTRCPVCVHLPGGWESPHTHPPPAPRVVQAPQRLPGNNHNPALLSIPQSWLPSHGRAWESGSSSCPDLHWVQRPWQAKALGNPPALSRAGPGALQIIWHGSSGDLRSWGQGGDPPSRL